MAATSWTGQARSFLTFCEGKFGSFKPTDGDEKALELVAEIGLPKKLAKVSAEVAASVLRQLYRGWDARADKTRDDWRQWRTRWSTARDAVGGKGRTAILTKAETWGPAGVMPLAMLAAFLLEQDKADLIAAHPNPANDHAWVREFMRHPEDAPGDTFVVPNPATTDAADAALVTTPTDDDDEGKGGILPLLLLFLL